jgi:hypothetical protein
MATGMALAPLGVLDLLNMRIAFQKGSTRNPRLLDFVTRTE